MTRKARILVVDDSRSMVMIVERVLKKEGYEVFTAYDGKEGLQKARELKPDLMILDIMMPEMDGYQVCQRLNSDPETAGIAVLMLTAKGHSPITGLKDRMAGFEVGAIEFLTKPVTAKELLKRVKSVLWSGGF